MALSRSPARQVGEAEGIKAGLSKTLSLTLKPGHYVLICNLADHHSRGMHVDLTVR